MKTSIAVLWVLAVYFFILTVVYTVWSVIDTSEVEWIGSIAIGLSGVLSVFIAFYLQIQLKNQGGVLPEDRLEAEIDEGDPEIGFYSPWSWWPLVIAAGTALAFLGLAVGVWVSLYAIPIVLISLIGWTYEYHRGYFAR
jgi:hypothetical protein